jgi:hypothetical protein
VRFDYLHAPRPLLFTQLCALCVPPRLQAPFAALAAAVMIVGGAWGIDAYRLLYTLHVEEAYRQRYEQTQQALKRANLYYDRVRRIVELDRAVRDIAASGDANARMLAELARDLPPHAWLTGISNEGNGLALQGRAKDLSVVSGVMQGLLRSKRLHDPVLISAALNEAQQRDTTMTYEIQVDGAR